MVETYIAEYASVEAVAEGIRENLSAEALLAFEGNVDCLKSLVEHQLERPISYEVWYAAEDLLKSQLAEEEDEEEEEEEEAGESFVFESNLDIRESGRYLGRVDTDGELRLSRGCHFSEAEIRSEIRRQYEREESWAREDWPEEFLRLAGLTD